jgi:hypothetical protein
VTWYLADVSDVLWVEGINQKGAALPPKQASLIYPSGSNQNHRIEFPEPDGRGDPRPDRAILVVLERSFRTFRYMSLRPGDSAYPELKHELSTRTPVGLSRSPDTRRVLMSYGDLKAVWPHRSSLRL